MAGIFLLLDLKGEVIFDIPRVRELLSHLPGVHGLHESEQDLFFCEFAFLGDRTIVHSSSPSCISVGGHGIADMEFALELQRLYGSTIHAVDQDCSFIVPLVEVSSRADFEEKMIKQFGIEKF